MAICPNGHNSVADDFCDACGTRIATSPVRVVGRHHAGGPRPAGSPDDTCPWCGNPSSGQFCKQCGFRVRRPFAPLTEPPPSNVTSWSAVTASPAAPVSSPAPSPEVREPPDMPAPDLPAPDLPAPDLAAPDLAAPDLAAPSAPPADPDRPAFLDWFSSREPSELPEPPPSPESPAPADAPAP